MYLAFSLGHCALKLNDVLLQINWVLLISRQGKVRLAKWFSTMSPKAKTKITKDVTQLVLARRVSVDFAGLCIVVLTILSSFMKSRMCNFLEYKGEQELLMIIYV